MYVKTVVLLFFLRCVGTTAQPPLPVHRTSASESSSLNVGPMSKQPSSITDPTDIAQPTFVHNGSRIFVEEGYARKRNGAPSPAVQFRMPTEL